MARTILIVSSELWAVAFSLLMVGILVVGWLRTNSAFDRAVVTGVMPSDARRRFYRRILFLLGLTIAATVAFWLLRGRIVQGVFGQMPRG